MAKCKAENIPQEMKEARRWFTCREEKKPLRKEWNKPGSWKGFADAVAGSRPYPGFALGDGFICLDFDKVLYGDKNTPGAEYMEILEKIKELSPTTYTEKSQSGRGFHSFYRAKIPKDCPSQIIIQLGPILENSDVDKRGKPNGNKLEVYTGNGKGKFIAVTGNRVGTSNTVADGTTLLEFLIERAGRKETGRQGAGNGTTARCIPADEWPLTVDEIPGRIRKSKQGRKFAAFFDCGDYEKYLEGRDDTSASVADAVLMSMLPFWCGGNPEIMEAVFSKSALAQGEKWQNRADYRQRTIRYALNKWDGTLYSSPPTAQEDFDPLAPEDTIDNPCWPIVDDKGKPLKVDWENVEYLLKELGISCKYNILTKQLEYCGHDLEHLTLDSASNVIRGLAHRNGLKISKNDLDDSLNTISEKASYSPVRDFLTAVKGVWDGNDHIGEVFSHFEIDPAYAEHQPFYLRLFTKWLAGAARIAFNKGQSTMQGVLVLQGPQGIGKTRFIYAILPNPTWGADGLTLNPKSKDSIMAVMGFWLVELGELGESLRKERLDLLKQYLTKRTDTLRRPYGKAMENRPRTTAFIGTVNGSGFLNDRTGDRRFWTIPLLKVHDLESIDPVQLWAHVVNLEGVDPWLDDAELASLTVTNESFKSRTDEEIALEDLLDWDAPIEKWSERTPTTISWEIGLQGKKPVSVGRAINALARTDDRIRVIAGGGRTGRRYLLPPTLQGD